MTAAVVATARVIDQVDQIGASVDAAKDNAVESLGVDPAALEEAQAATEEAGPAIAEGFLTHLVSGVHSLVGLASGAILGSLIMYYLLKDGTRLRRSVVAQIDPTIRDGVEASSAMPAASCATTGAAAPPCPPSCRWSSAWPACFSASRSVHHHRGELRRRLHPLHRRLPRWGLAVIIALGEAESERLPSCSSCSPPTWRWRTSWSPG